MIFLVGCSNKPEIITKVKIERITIPDNYFHLSPIDLNRSIKTNKDASLFMLDLYGAYEECVIHLDSIKELNQGDQDDKNH